MLGQFANDFIASLPSRLSTTRFTPGSGLSSNYDLATCAETKHLDESIDRTKGGVGHRQEIFHNQGQMLLWDCSELELEGELDRSRSADLVQGIQTAIRATGAQAACQRLR